MLDMTKKQKLIFIYTVLVGLMMRAYLILKLSAWYDEFTTLKIISHTLGEVVSGKLDPVHPSGYYTLLKLWSFVSKNVVWLRVSTLIFFLININLFFILGKMAKDKSVGILFVVFYAFSGYFLIFDWQFRMYSGLATFILFSYILFNQKLNKKKLSLFFVINLIGLFFDYGFLFYHIPLLFWSILKMVNNTNERENWLKKTSTLVASLTVFAIISGAPFWNNFGDALKLIDWLPNFTSPLFFIPFFLGTFSVTALTLTIFPVLLLGLKNMTGIHKGLLFISAVSLSGSILLKHFGIVLLHTRSMQVVGIACLILLSNGWSQIYRYQKTLAIIILGVFILNSLYIITKIPSWPAEYLITYISE